ncbi:hypothetical protein VOLCADRAFT_87755 [Volvox carteri f. nagariensis]|uniref:Uncharacterized protein n=1 Tax=Volvox carteri f. nagariensis TaxID=3068 RepID=D8TM58_VOLCA|nr:uncharacterized protein VOLCADRAFT_87755 [Volvox carteri f. nagariensis]EFJ51587.1 hypothetical protein VOLCADRAFT_87755 [Volvox carteri f. nagariensis]|eukprot:XP_002947539.1 hypothetical protein VOLCADRAFT_87755 [Volvox carteri f. nagariensis]
MALELMQESSIRNNPGSRLTPVQEAVVILVAVTAEEMLYRAVLLTLLGLWLRDRAYEGGAEEVLTLQLQLLLGGYGGGGGTWELDTAAAAQWAALGVGLALGATVFAAKAWQETRLAERLRAVQAAQAEEAAKELRKQRLLGQVHMTEAQLLEEREKVARLQAAQASLVASIGVQGALVWMMEGGREVYQVAASGASFLLTGNLAAPLAGSLAAQLLVSAYQRLGLRRTVQRRAKVLEARRRAALEKRQEQQQATTTTAVSETPDAAAAAVSAIAVERPAGEVADQPAAEAVVGRAGLGPSPGGSSTVEGPEVTEVTEERVEANVTAGGGAEGLHTYTLNTAKYKRARAIIF